MSQPRSSDSWLGRCTTCKQPVPVEDDTAVRLFEPYHAAVSWTYMPPERAEEALLRIRRLLKEAVGWWSGNDEQLEREGFDRLGIE